MVAIPAATVATADGLEATPLEHVALAEFVSPVVTYVAVPPCFTLTEIVELVYPGTGISTFTGLLKLSPKSRIRVLLLMSDSKQDHSQ